MSSFYVHPTAVVEKNVSIGNDTKIWLFSHLMEGCKIGDSCQIGQNVYIGKSVVVGNGVKIQNNVSVYEAVEIEDDVFCGPSMVFTNVINPRSFIERKNEFKKTRVQKGATIGANATIVCGVSLGRYCMIGAGSVVTKNVPDFALIMGVPGIQKGWVCSCGVQLEEALEFKCATCGNEYILNKDSMQLEETP